MKRMENSLLKNTIFTKGILIHIVRLCLFSGISYGDIRTYYINDYCKSRYGINMVSEKISQLKLVLSPVDIYFLEQGYCDVKIETWNTYTKLMFYFEELNLHCSVGHLEFYENQDRNTRINGLENDICGEVTPKGIFTVDTGFLNIMIISTRSQLSSSVFSIIVTAFRDDSCSDYAHKCDNSRCIDKDLVCNGFNSCGDNSSCSSSSSTVVVVIIGCIVGLFFIVFALMMFCTSRQQHNRSNIRNMSSVQSNSQTAIANNGITFISHRNQSNRQVNQVPSMEGNTDSQQNRENYSQNIEMEDGYQTPPSYTILFGNSSMSEQETNEANNDNNNANSHQTLNSQSQNVSPNTHDETLPSYSELFATNIKRV